MSPSDAEAFARQAGGEGALPWLATPLRRALETQRAHALLIHGPGRPTCVERYNDTPDRTSGPPVAEARPAGRRAGLTSEQQSGYLSLKFAVTDEPSLAVIFSS